uniref:Uncharacterized protein n=1 Tax=mine drainage metagenome TaxID=410659 RepID=E6PQ66_9ZZZZ
MGTAQRGLDPVSAASRKQLARGGAHPRLNSLKQANLGARLQSRSFGSVAEWSIAPVLKTGNGQPFVSSNLTASARIDPSIFPSHPS